MLVIRKCANHGARSDCRQHCRGIAESQNLRGELLAGGCADLSEQLRGEADDILLGGVKVARVDIDKGDGAGRYISTSWT